MVLLPMLTLAVTFEKIHHYCHHKVVHQTKAHIQNIDLGKKDIIAKGHTPGLYLIRLFERSGEEFMVLGFVAFCVWMLNKGSVFQRVVRPFDEASLMGVGAPYNTYGPPTGGELLHLVEDVHMQLFIAMILYFTFMLAAVRYIEKSIESWHRYEEELRSKGYPARVEGKMKGMFSRVMCGEMMSLFSYHSVRLYFIKWMRVKAKKAKEKQAKTSPDGSGGAFRRIKSKASNAGIDDHNFNVADLTNFGEDFDFATYLIVHLDEIMDDMLMIHETTWGFVATFYAILGLIARFGYAGLGDKVDRVQYSCACIFVIIEIFILFYVEFQMKRDVHHNSKKQQTMRNILQAVDNDSHNDNGPDAASKASQNDDAKADYNPINAIGDLANKALTTSVEKLQNVHSMAHHAEMLVLRFLQAILLFSCFFCARFIGSPPVYQMSAAMYETIYGVPQWGKWMVVLFILFFTFRTLPVLICELNLMLRLPPFVDNEECAVAQAICDEQTKYLDERYGPLPGKSNGEVSNAIPGAKSTTVDVKPAVATGLQANQTVPGNKVQPVLNVGPPTSLGDEDDIISDSVLTS